MLKVSSVLWGVFFVCEGTFFAPYNRDVPAESSQYYGRNANDFRPFLTSAALREDAPIYSETNRLDYEKRPPFFLLLLPKINVDSECCAERASQLSTNFYPSHKGLLQLRLGSFQPAERAAEERSEANEQNFKPASESRQNFKLGVVQASAVGNKQYEIIPAPAAPSNYILQPTAQHVVRPSGGLDQKPVSFNPSFNQQAGVFELIPVATQQRPPSEPVLTSQQQQFSGSQHAVPQPNNELFAPPVPPTVTLSSNQENVTSGSVVHQEHHETTLQTVTNNNAASSVQSSSISNAPLQPSTQEVPSQPQLPSSTSNLLTAPGMQQHAPPPPPPPPHLSTNDKIPSGTYVATVSYGPNHPSLIYTCTLTSLLNPLSADAHEFVPGPFGYSCKVSKGRPSLGSHVEQNYQQPMPHPVVPFKGPIPLQTVIPVGLVTSDAPSS